MIPIDDAEHATLIASLRFYQAQGQGEPNNRSDEIHDLATNGDMVMSSLDDEGIDALCQKINFGGEQPRPLPEKDFEWSALASQRGWPPVVLEHARAASDMKYGAESIIELPGGFQIRCPAYPEECGYVRIVDGVVGDGVELMYWTSDEWQQDPQDVMGAILGLAKSVKPYEAMEAAVSAAAMARLAARQALLRAANICSDLAGSKWVSVEAANEIREAIEAQAAAIPAAVVFERTANPGEMARHICALIGLDKNDEAECEQIVAREFPKSDWLYLVGNDDTSQGYWEWALGVARERLAEEEGSDSALVQRQKDR